MNSLKNAYVRKFNTPYCAKNGKRRRTFKYVNGVLTEVTSTSMKRKLATISNKQHESGKNTKTSASHQD
jgi:hypothetical protein